MLNFLEDISLNETEFGGWYKNTDISGLSFCKVLRLQ
jgi:hypothetical protein